jgi:hypothetical protein
VTEILRHPWMQNIPLDSNSNSFNCVVSVFTDLEKAKINEDFAYYNVKGEPTDG